MKSKFGRGGGARSLPWRYACPAARHRSLERRNDGVYCHRCGRDFDVAIDLKENAEVTIEEIRRAQVGTRG